MRGMPVIDYGDDLEVLTRRGKPLPRVRLPHRALRELEVVRVLRAVSPATAPPGDVIPRKRPLT
jgi:hypothetical protein